MLPIHRVKKTVFNYDEIPAGYYHRAMLEGKPVQRFWHREKFRELARRIGPEDRVLDVGCGPGSFLHILAEEKPGIQGLGVDIASRQIDYAREFFGRSLPSSRIEFRTLDATGFELPFESGTFDVVTSVEVIEHIHPFLAAQCLREARRVLKPDGRLLVTTPNYRSFWPLIEWLMERMSPVKYHEQHISQFTPNAFVKFLELCGFEITDLRTIFVAAPFLAGLGQGFARRVLAVEQAMPLVRSAGSLLVAEARVWAGGS